jgi:RHO1 GDP-GTP exchange protein 1/2
VKPPTNRPKSTLMKRNSFNKSNPPAAQPARADGGRNGYSITFVHLGRKGYSLTLWASTLTARKKWQEHIAKQQELLRERSTFFECVTLSAGFFGGRNKVNCAAPFCESVLSRSICMVAHAWWGVQVKGRRIAYGTDEGVFFADLKDQAAEPVKVLSIADVTQVDILEEYQLLVVLSGASVCHLPSPFDRSRTHVLLQNVT